MARIFISYRRQDSPSMTGRIYDKLETTFGSDRVFRDIDDIGAGQDFRAKIAQEVNQSDVLLVIIGPKWENITDQQGNRRLDNPDDFVRLEVEEGLKNSKKIVIPVLVENAPMPKPEALPKSMRELCYRNAISVRQDPDFHPDMQKLIDAIRKITKTGTPLYKKKSAMIGAGLLIIGIIAIFVATLLASQATPIPEATNAITSSSTLSPIIESSPAQTTEPTFTNTPDIAITETVTETSQPSASGPVRIGVIQLPDTIYKDTVKRLDNLGFEAEWIDVSSSYKEFSKYDVVYLPIGWSSQNEIIESHASEYQLFVNEGGGLVIEQPAVRSPFTSKLFPYDILFNSFAYNPDEAPPIVRVEHEIAQNLRTSELPGPGDKMGPKDKHWQVITTSAKTNYATLVIAEYGEGRIVVMSSGISKNAQVKYQLGDHFIERFVAWVSNINKP